MQNKVQKLLHIHGQSFWHEPAFLIGNTSSLRAIQEAIEQAINKASESGKPGVASTECVTADGEGYQVFIICDEGDFKQRALPYTDEVASEKDPEAIWPWQDIEEGLKGK